MDIVGAALLGVLNADVVVRVAVEDELQGVLRDHPVPEALDGDGQVATAAVEARRHVGTAGPVDEVDVSGRLIGGCIETLTPIAGAPFGDVARFGEQHAAAGLLVYLEAADAGSFDVARSLHGFRLHGWFDHARAVLIGRTRAPGHQELSQHEAVLDALGMLNIPIVVDVDCGYVPPFMPIVAMGRLVGGDGRWQSTQTFC